MEPHSVPNDLYRGLHCGPDSRFLNTPAQAPLPPKCSTLLHVLSSNLSVFILIYSSLSIRPYLFVLFWSDSGQPVLLVCRRGGRPFASCWVPAASCWVPAASCWAPAAWGRFNHIATKSLKHRWNIVGTF